MSQRNRRDRPLKFAALSVAVAAAVGSSALATANEASTINQIERYCTVSWRNAGIAQQDWSDCTQQALQELLERVSRNQLQVAMQNNESTERQELNRTVWRTIKRWQRAPRPVQLEESFARGTCDARQDAWDEVMTAARQHLSERQTRILKLTREGWQANEIAGELGITAARVSDEKYKAIRKLRQQLDTTA
jgi:RNA polymerase sigma factor (sigma-70 family)